MLHLASLTAKNPPNQRKAPPKKLQLRYFWDFKYTKKPAIKYHLPLPEDICSMYDIIDQRISHHTSCTSWPYWNVEQINIFLLKLTKAFGRLHGVVFLDSQSTLGLMYLKSCYPDQNSIIWYLQGNICISR